MKKRLIVTALLLLAVVFVLASCDLSFLNGGGPGNNGGNASETMIFGEGVKTNIIVGAGSGIDTNIFDNAIYESCGIVPGLRDDSSETGRGEIVIGDTAREITAMAKDALNRSIRSFIISSNDEEFAKKDTVGYGIYAKDGALALVWTDEISRSLAFDYFVEEYLSRKSLDSKPEISDMKVFSVTEYYEEKAAVQRAAEWKKLKKSFIDLGCTDPEAERCVEAVKSFYAMADENVYIWLANLYDPNIGGFYYSNSGRDTEGFLPDVESTLQAINILQNNGMFDDFGSTPASRLQNALPEQMQDKIVEFVKGLQSDADGYFHHPQWAGMDSSWTSRLNRDLNWSIQLLEWFNARPNYSLPTVRPVSSDNLTGKLGGSAVSLVSKVIAADAANMDFLATPETFRAYLESFDWESQSYQAANTISSFTIQLHARGQEYIDVYDSFLRERQNPENGLWEDGIYYASTNGLMKVVAAFNSLGIELQYPDKAFESAITMAKHIGADEEGFPANHIVDVYNPWYVMSDILLNVENHGDEVMAESLRARLCEEAEELITMSVQKTAPFKKYDGSFGYNWDFSPNTSQGAPVAVPGSIEGDVNGCVMSFGVIGNLLETFGIEKPRRYYMTDYLVFIDEISDLGEIIKDADGIPAEKITFDGEPVGNTEPGAFSSVSITNGIGQTELREGSEEDVVFHLTDTSHKTGTSIRVTPGGVPVGASRCVVEFDINVKSASGDVFYQIFLGSTYQLTLKNDGGNVRLGDSSGKDVTNDFGVSFKKGEWHTVRVEYYFTGAEDTTVTKIFLDGNLRAESNNFYGKKSEGGAKPDLLFHELHFYTLFDPTVDVCLDNIFANKDRELYKSEPIVNPYHVSDFEDSEYGKLPMGVTADDSSYEITDNPFADEGSGASGKVLHFFAPSGMASVEKNIESLVNTGNAYVFESDVYIDSLSSGGAVTQTYIQSADGSIMAFTLRAGSDPLGEYAELCVLNKKNNTAAAPLAKIYLDRWVKLRIEYYRYQYEIGEAAPLWDGVKVKVFLDTEEVFNGLCEYPSPNTLSKDAIQFYHYVLSGKSLDMYFDNMIFETAQLTYVDEEGNEVSDPEKPEFPSGGKPASTPAEDGHDGFFDFESASQGSAELSGLSTNPNQAEYGNDIYVDDDGSGNNALKFITVPSKVSGNSVQFEAAAAPSQSAGCQLIEFKILVKKADGDENYLQLYTYNSKGEYISSYNILIPKKLTGEIEISSRLSESVNESSKRVSLPMSEGYIKFRFEYYESKKLTQIYVNDSFVCECYGAYNGNSSAGKLTSFKMATLMRADFELYVDDVRVENIEKDHTVQN